MFRALLIAAALGAAAAQPAVLQSCSSYIQWKSLTVFPASPNAGDIVSVNGTGTLSVPVTGGAGTINAFLFGDDVFVAPITTCGLGQQIDGERVRGVLSEAAGHVQSLSQGRGRPGVGVAATPA